MTLISIPQTELAHTTYAGQEVGKRPEKYGNQKKCDSKRSPANTAQPKLHSEADVRL